MKLHLIVGVDILNKGLELNKPYKNLGKDGLLLSEEIKESAPSNQLTSIITDEQDINRGILVFEKPEQLSNISSVQEKETNLVSQNPTIMRKRTKKQPPVELKEEIDSERT